MCIILNENKTNLTKGTPRTAPAISKIEGGQYWHRGIEFALQICFKNLMQPTTIEININIDGLPIYKSSHDQFWPILFNVHEMPQIKPMAIGIFYGKTKPTKVEEF